MGLPVAQLILPRVCAMVSPALANRFGFVFGNGRPVVGAPWLMGSERPERPCEMLAVLLWQPLQDLVSPGSTCSQLWCCAVTRCAFASRMSMVKGTLAGTWICTDPSG